VLIGGIIIACGHFSMVFHSLTFFYAGMTLIAIGTGLLKPNISAMVGGLYSENDPRRDSGFSIFYMGINIGALLAPLVVGFMAQHERFKTFVASIGFNPLTSWHWGFGAAGVGMTIGLITFVLNRRKLQGVSEKVMKKVDVADAATKQPLTSSDWKRIGAVFIFFLFTILFWGAYEQKGASLNLLAKALVRTEVFGFNFPSSWLQSCTPLFVILLAPVFSYLWVRLGDKQPSSPVKFTLGLVFIGLAYVLIVPGVALTAHGKISPLWLVGLYFLEVVGEMCLSPVGLSTVTKLAPAKLVGIMMGVWFLAASFGSKLAGYLSGFYVPDAGVLVKLFGGIAAGLLVSAALLALLTPKVKRLMGEVR
jgi:POT family proton-dependent oligopeptide transporter